MSTLNLSLGKASRKKNRNRRNEALWGYACVAPLSIGLLMFLAAPLGFSFYISLTRYDLFNEPVFVGFANFQRIFSPEGAEFWRSVGNAFIYSIGVLLSMILSLIIASIFRGKIHGKNFFKGLFFLPTICSAVAVTIMWKRMYDYNYGTINQILGLFGIEGIYWLSEEYVVFAIMFMQLIFGFGTSMLLYISAINSIPKDYYEAADIDGANVFQKFFHITVPSVSPISFYIMVTGLIGSIQGFTTYQVMTNGSPSNTMMPVLLIYKYSGGDYGAFYGYASAMGIVLGGIIVILTIVEFIFSRKWVHYAS
jgi:multiple sugar transport system permease protein